MVKYQSVWVGPLSRVTRLRIRIYEFEHNKIEDGLSNQRIYFWRVTIRGLDLETRLLFLIGLRVCVCVRACVCVCVYISIDRISGKSLIVIAGICPSWFLLIAKWNSLGDAVLLSSCYKYLMCVGSKFHRVFSFYHKWRSQNSFPEKKRVIVYKSY